MEGWRWVLKVFGNENRRNPEKVVFQKSKFRSPFVHQASRLCHCTEEPEMDRMDWRRKTGSEMLRVQCTLCIAGLRQVVVADIRRTSDVQISTQSVPKPSRSRYLCWLESRALDKRRKTGTRSKSSTPEKLFRTDTVYC
jgi:hypothetical protein